MALKVLAPGVAAHSEGVTTGILLSGDAALVINPGAPGLAEALAEAGVRSVEKLLFTHHRRELADALGEVLERHSPALGGPEAEASLFTHPERYWDDPGTRWNLLFGHVPYHVTHARPVPLTETYAEGDRFEWRGWSLTVLATPGYTDGSVSYLADNGEVRVVFCGDVIYGPGMVRDLYSLQHENTSGGHRVGDYHGFMGSAGALVSSLEQIRALGADLLLPAHGDPIGAPDEAIDALVAGLQLAYANYVEVSALRWYFPDYFAPHAADGGARIDAETAPFPPEVRRILGTTWLLRSRSGRALLIDPYTDEATRRSAGLVDAGEVSGFDGIWITHYHSDHMEGTALARQLFGCPVITDEIMADVLRTPERYLLTCLSPKQTPIDRPTRHGETWKWQEYTLTAYHLPGQTYYHSGLLAAADAGPRLFFAGDSFTPTGIDDYCSWNRNFLAPGAGYDACIRLLRELRPDWIFNQHVDVAFRFADADYERMLANLAERRRLFAQLLPWDHPDTGTDEYWVHTYPYEQEARPGSTLSLQVRVHNHSGAPKEVCAAVELPEGWSAGPEELQMVAPSRTESRLCFDVTVPVRESAGRHVLPVRLRYGEVWLGSFREAIVNVVP